MRDVLCLVLATVVVVIGAPIALAGDVEAKGYPKITIGGEVDLRAIFRNDDLLDINENMLRVPSGSVRSHGDFFVDPNMTLNIDVDSNSTPTWKSRLSLKTPQWVVDDLGSVIRFVSVREAYVELPEFVVPQFTFRAGIMNYSTDVRGNGHSFLFHPYESESAFGYRIGNASGNPAVIPPGVIGFLENGGGVGSTGTSATPAAFADGVGPGTSTGEANTIETAGILGRGTFEMGGYGHIDLDLFYFDLLELRDVGPGDEVVFGGVASYDMQERGRIQALYMVFENDSSSHIHNLGVGASVKPIHDDNGDLEAYGEFVYQFGKYATNVPDLGGRNLLQDSFATYAGIRYQMKVFDLKPGIDLSYWFIKGDNTPGGNVNNDFVSYENVDDTLIVEENNYGLDIDTNYESIKVRFLLGWDWPTTNDVPVDFEFSLLYAFFQLEQEERNAPEKIGDEVDVMAKWNVSPDLSLFAAAGWLFDAKAFNHAHDTLGISGDPLGNDLAIATAGATLKF